MHKYLLTLLSLFLCETVSAQVVGTMQELSADRQAAATRIVFEGKALSTAGNSDFRRLRDCCPRLEEIDLRHSLCREIPANALFACHRLKTLTLPDSVRIIGSRACYACDGLTELVLPPALEEVGDEAFAACRRLRRLTVQGTPHLGDMAFAGLDSLRELRLTSPTPPPAEASAFFGLRGKGIKLSVPRGSEKAYRAAPGWSTFFEKKVAEQAAALPNLIPVPTSVRQMEGMLNLRKLGGVEAAPELANEADHALRLLAERTNFRPGRGKARLRLCLDTTLNRRTEEAYRLEVSASGIVITGASPRAVFWGLMTLSQLLETSDAEARCANLPALIVEDEPRTALRELMVDPARIFIPLEELKPFVVEMARFKFNALHLHLVDDQAWRMEIKSYPLLTELGSSRVGMDDMPLEISGYYTQQEMRDFVAFAARHHVEVIPEIEMPGHEIAAIHCYPQLTCGARKLPIRLTSGVSNELLCPGEEFVYEFLGNVFRELSEVFPSRYVHLGGDEAGNPPLGCWTHCEKCDSLRRKLGITATDGSENWRLQKYLFDRVIDTLRTRHGKTPMFWYETDFREIPEGCITFAWRHGLTAAAIRAAQANGRKIMLCPGEHCYLDYPAAPGDMPEVNWGMPVTSLEQTYRLDPAWGFGEDFEKNNLMGVAGTFWSECISSPERLFYMAYPRAMALAEAGWSIPANRSWDSFRERVKHQMRRHRLRRF
ncbi:MAG: family 20 glycosylhydrolase [Alloprevotella sp.]